MGHFLVGIGFVLIGLWQSMNIICSFARDPWNFKTRSWFAVNAFKGKLRYMELYAIMGGSLLFMASELFILREKHHPLDDDLTIPLKNLKYFEHSTMTLFLFLYALLARLLDAGDQDGGDEGGILPNGLAHLMGALAFSQELLLFHLHSTEHVGVEGHYHWLLQLVILVCVLCMLMELSWPRSFLVVFVRTLAITFQGVWLIQLGFLFVPFFAPKGCELTEGPHGRMVVCDSDDAIIRAKALATLQFSWYLAALVSSALLALAYVIRHYATARKYHTIDAVVEECGKQKKVHEQMLSSY
ncbi:hypothetical protein KP509_12G020800 [Ceratopteris richardii]|nr:hypothetical protein KP509_12G020800 [Ceratopteris richardii]